MLPYKTILHFDKALKTPLYIQLSNSIIRNISAGLIPTTTKLPGARTLASLLGLSRRTVVSAYEELDAQGWIVTRPNQGCFVNDQLPVNQYSTIGANQSVNHNIVLPEQSNHLDFLNYYKPIPDKNVTLTFDTGYPDVRLAPLKALGQRFNRVLNSKLDDRIMNYAASFGGHTQLRSSMIQYLAETRGIQTREQNILVTRGSLMAFNLIFQCILKPGDQVIVGDLSFQVAKDIIKIHHGQLVEVPVDDNGMDVDAIEQKCLKHKIRAVFVMPHHHHPTTVSMPAERRLKLLNLAYKYGFYIIEDDYDYDFHYDSSPILPMASADPMGMVIYVGSFSKIVAPGLRTGFIVAPPALIKDVTRLSRFIDCHGNPALEKTLALLINEGYIYRHLKKSLKLYRERRDLFCTMMNDRLEKFVSFKKPEGGLAAWVNFDPSVPLDRLRKQALGNQLLISRTVFKDGQGQPINAIRMGFASLDNGEISMAVNALHKSIQQIV